MRCKSCDYALWNLTTRQCPECGTPFTPDQFEFVPNSVQFCCLQCGQAYYGTDAKGHLQPREFNCVNCGNHVQMNDMVLRPAAGITDRQTQQETMPWLERRKIGAVRAWFSMIGKAMTSPQRLIRATPIDSSVGAAWWYAVLTNAIFQMSAFLPLGCLFLLPGMFGGPGSRGSTGAIAVAPGFGAAALAGIAVAAVAVLIWTGCTHCLLRITGPTQAGIGRTMHGICYSAGANALMALPCFGIYFFWMCWIWWAVSAVLMVKEGQKVSGVRASFAVLALPVVLMLGIVTLYIVVISMTMRAASSYAASAPPSARTNAFYSSTMAVPEAQALTSAIIAYASDHNGAGPRHAGELLTAGGVPIQSFLSSATVSDVTTASLGEITLAQFQAMPLTRRRTFVNNFAAAQPAGVIAHRLGDFVFTYHGIDLTHPDPGLWIVAMSPDPDANDDSTPLAIGTADGSVQTVMGDFPTQLQRQNALRATLGLKPLPEPATVTHDNPALDGDDPAP